MTTSPPRIVFAIETTLGNAVFLQNLQRALAERTDITPVWLPIDEHVDDVWERLPLVRSRLSLRGGLRARAALHRIAAEEPVWAAVVHTQRMAHLAHDFMSRVPSVISTDATPSGLEDYLRYYGMRSQHGGWLGAAKHALHRRTYSVAKGMLSFSAFTKRSLVEEYGVPDTRVHVLWPSVDTTLWRPAPERKPRDGVVRLLFVGGDLGRKGGQLLLRWARETRQRGWRLDLVTSSDISTPPGVHLHVGVRPNSPELIELAQAADLFVLPTLADMSSWAIAEAKAAGLAVVTTATGGVGELVRDGVDGRLVPVGDYAALASALDDLVARPDTLREMGCAARRMAEERMDLRTTCDQMLAFIRRVTHAGEAPRYFSGTDT
ncbi:group 1 glycosyl transferase [Corallococcus sp. H22C18031201]|uniref:glycosyltransferase family 4 protein n=1 Tax=Citreicoccus inhibens TaxID=2849499 RepID=UPI000E772385|nr:glycosyltransferase family 4 protein [Citreicoccus inhibens]MBU8894000.1 glycosyltransferase family 4 protein [Citreicoccus inhibens]RJS23275.1 group 1 glycosyl transferase [Corallococcus sp. H22C18031201]